MGLQKPIKAKQICSIFGYNQNLGYIMPMAFMISCEGSLHSNSLISPQATLLHYFLTFSTTKNQSALKTQLRTPISVHLSCYIEVWPNNEKHIFNPLCGLSNLVMMQSIIVMFNGVQELTKYFSSFLFYSLQYI